MKEKLVIQIYWPEDSTQKAHTTYVTDVKGEKGDKSIDKAFDFTNFPHNELSEMVHKVENTLKSYKSNAFVQIKTYFM